MQFADKFKDHDEALRPGLIELETFLTYEKQLRNLQLQEARLARRMAKDAAELRELQHARRKKDLQAEKDVLVRAAQANGFEFSTAEIEPCLKAVRSAAMDGMTNLANAVALRSL